MDELDSDTKLLLLGKFQRKTKIFSAMQFSQLENDELWRISGKIASSQTSNIISPPSPPIPVSQRILKLEIFLPSLSPRAPFFPSSSCRARKQPAENSNFLIYLIFGCFGFGAVSSVIWDESHLRRFCWWRKMGNFKASYGESRHDSASIHHLGILLLRIFLKVVLNLRTIDALALPYHYRKLFFILMKLLFTIHQMSWW